MNLLSTSDDTHIASEIDNIYTESAMCINIHIYTIQANT